MEASIGDAIFGAPCQGEGIVAEPARLADIVATSKAVRATSGRLEKRARLGELFARLDPGVLKLAATFLAGETLPASLNVGWGAVVAAERALATPEVLPLFAAMTPPAASTPQSSPTLVELQAAFEALARVGGSGAAKKRQGILQRLLAPLDAEERQFLGALFLGELRQGASRAVVLEAVADAFALEPDALRRAVMFAGALGEVLEKVARDGAAALEHFAPRPGVPVEPMLAAQAEDLEVALGKFGGRAAAEWKLDGVRVQVHRLGPEVHVFSRQLREVSALTPETVELARQLPVQSVILDGELIGLDAEGRPVPFQDLMSQFARESKATRAKPARAGEEFPALSEGPRAGDAPLPPGSAQELARLVPVFFDLLEHDGEICVEKTYEERRVLLERLVPAAHLVPQRHVEDIEAARAVFDEALAAGHEGVLLKQLDSPYSAGRRGAAWCKVKPAVTLDLVILAAEWGHGRRQGFLSNLHLGARDLTDPERFQMLGKTFKGLTDQMLREMTADLLQLETRREGHIVHVRPVRVVEIAFDEVQRSPRYDSGFALRFARVKRFRPDKSAAEANTIDEVQSIHARRT